MIVQPYYLYVERIEPEKNMAQSYALAVQPTLFARWRWCAAGGGSGHAASRRCTSSMKRSTPLGYSSNFSMKSEIEAIDRNHLWKSRLSGIRHRSALMTRPPQADRDFVFLDNAREFHDHHQ